MKALSGSTLASGLLFPKVPGTRGQALQEVMKGKSSGRGRKDCLPCRKKNLFFLPIFLKLIGSDSPPYNFESPSKGRYFH